MEQTVDHPDTAERPLVNLSGYRFVRLESPAELRAALERALGATGVLGTVLVAEEGINVALSGTEDEIRAARACLDADPRLAGLWLKESRSATRPFARLKVRLRPEIIAFDGTAAAGRAAARPPAPTVSPETLRDWLDEGRPLTLLDARNGYEIASGSFRGAETLGIERFRDFAAGVERALDEGRLDPERPVVTFCTGGVRCEKAAPWLLERGFREVWQIEGGILNWFERCGDAHWEGRCFVFDDRVELDPGLAPTGATLCGACHRAVAVGARCDCSASSADPGDHSRTAIDTV